MNRKNETMKSIEIPMTRGIAKDNSIELTCFVTDGRSAHSVHQIHPAPMGPA
jgi:hypothetical protein